MKTKEAMKGKKKTQHHHLFSSLEKALSQFLVRNVSRLVTFVHVNAACRPARALMVVLTIPVYLHRPGGS